MNRKLENFFLIIATVLIFLLLYTLKLERDEVIAKNKEINSLKVQVNDLKSKNFEKAMIIEGYENRLSKFHISNLEELGLEKKEDK